MNTTLETLKSARSRLSKSTKWTKGDYFRDVTTRKRIWPNEIRKADDRFVCMCSLGAIMLGLSDIKKPGTRIERHDPSVETVEEFLEESIRTLFRGRAMMQPELSGHLLPWFNDHPETTFEDIARVFDHAIERAERA